MKRTIVVGLVVVGLALPAFALPEVVLGIGGLVTPTLEFKGFKGFGFLPRFFGCFDSGDLSLFGDVWMNAVREEGSWTETLLAHVNLGVTWDYLEFSIVELGIGAFVSPTVVISSAEEGTIGLTLGKGWGVRLLFLEIKPPFSSFGLTLDLVPGLGLVPGLVMGVRL